MESRAEQSILRVEALKDTHSRVATERMKARRSTMESWLHAVMNQPQ